MPSQKVTDMTGITEVTSSQYFHCASSSADLKMSGDAALAWIAANLPSLPAISGANLTGLNASNLTTGTVPLARLSGITNSQISASAAIAYSKLALTGAVLNADLAGSIADTKLNTIATAGKVSDSALSSNVPLLDTENEFSEVNTFPSGIAFGSGASVPALFPNSATLECKLADDSNFAGMRVTSLELTEGGITGAGPSDVNLATTGNFRFGNGSFSFLNILVEGLNQWHAHPNPVMIDTVGNATFGDGQSFGNGTRVECDDANLFLKINCHSGPILLGDTDQLVPSLLMTINQDDRVYEFDGGPLRLPLFTTTARDLLTPTEGMLIGNTTTHKAEYYDGSNWTQL